MTIEEYVKRRIEELERFQEYWNKMSEEHAFPKEMHASEWDEQELAYINSCEN